MLVFNSKEEMLGKLSRLSYLNLKIADNVDKELDKKLQSPQEVYYITEEGIHIVGYCDCKTFKRG